MHCGSCILFEVVLSEKFSHYVKVIVIGLLGKMHCSHCVRFTALPNPTKNTFCIIINFLPWNTKWNIKGSNFKNKLWLMKYKPWCDHDLPSTLIRQYLAQNSNFYDSIGSLHPAIFSFDQNAISFKICHCIKAPTHLQKLLSKLKKSESSDNCIVDLQQTALVPKFPYGVLCMCTMWCQ